MTDLIKAADALAEAVHKTGYREDGNGNVSLLDPHGITPILDALTAYRQARESADGVNVEDKIQKMFNELVSEISNGFESGDLKFKIGKDGAAQPFIYKDATPCGNDWARAIVGLSIAFQLDGGGY